MYIVILIFTVIVLYISIFYIIRYYIRKYPSLTNDYGLTVRCFPYKWEKNKFIFQYKNKYGIWKNILEVDNYYKKLSDDRLSKKIKSAIQQIPEHFYQSPQSMINNKIFSEFKTIDDIENYHNNLYKELNYYNKYSFIKEVKKENIDFYKKFWNSL